MNTNESFLTRHVFFAMVLGGMLFLLGIVVMTSQTTLIAQMMALALIFSGVLTLRTVLTFAAWTGYFRVFTLAKGIICIFLGVWGILHARKSFELVMYLMGAQMLIGGVLSLMNSFQLRRCNNQPVGGVFSEGLFSLIVALVLFCAPQLVGQTLLLVVGLVVMASGVGLFIWGLRLRKIDCALGKVNQETHCNAEILEETNVGE